MGKTDPQGPVDVPLFLLGCGLDIRFRPTATHLKMNNRIASAVNLGMSKIHEQHVPAYCATKNPFGRDRRIMRNGY